MADKSNEQIIDDFEKDYTTGDDIWSKIHQNWQDDIDFTLNGNQWDQKERDNRLNSVPSRPTLVFNKSLPHILKITNDIKRMKPGVKVRAVGEEDKDLAEVRQGLQRSIERESNGQDVYNNALVNCVGGGVGFWRIINEYENSKSFDQVLRIREIDDSTCVRTSHWSQRDGSDIEFAIITEPITKKKFKAMTGKDADEFADNLDVPKCWGNGKEMYVHEYWYMELTRDTLCEVADPQTGEVINETAYLSDLQKYAKRDGLDVNDLIAVDAEGERITRDTTKPVVYWCKVAGKEVLEKKKWKGLWIPLVMVKGRMVRLRGEVKLHSLTHSLKDAQQAYNYARSAQIERMALTPKSPMAVPAGGLPKSEKYKYETMNTRNWPTISYNAWDEKGRQLPPPSRIPPIGLDPVFQQEILVSSDDIKAVTGQHDASLGREGNEKSGIAIRERKMEGDTSTFDFPYELGVAIRHSARIIDDLIPHTYDTERQITIIGDDDAEKVVWVNKDVEPDEKNKKGYRYDMNKGNFNIEVEMGLSQSTKRQETLMGLESLFSSNPAFSEILGDLYVMEQDWRFSDVAAKRIRKRLENTHPGLVEPEDGGEQLEVSPKVLQMHQQLQEMEQLFQEIQAENERLKADKSIEAQKAEDKAEVDFMNAETKRFEAEVKARVEADRITIEQARLAVAQAEANAASKRG